MKTVILCGGSGTRLWPISRKSTPKQFAQIFDEQSLFEMTIGRNLSVSDSFCIVVNEVQLPACQNQVSASLKNKTNFLIEPIGRNTAPAIALAAFDSKPDEILLVLPSDHMIKDQEEYKNTIAKAISLAKENKLVTFGITPTYPETGFGYIEANGSEVLSFKEKPDLLTAKKYLEQGNYFWNSGMFCFKASVFLAELEKYSPEIYSKTKETYLHSKIENNIRTFNHELMNKIPSNSIDYAVMEKSKIVNVVPSKFYWSDLGSFDSLSEAIEKDEFNNSKTENFYPLNSKNNLVIGNKKVIATFDVNDLIIVETQDALLIGKKGDSQKVKDIFEIIKEKHPKLLD